jgi:formylglycine-generating enzyme
MRAALMSLGAAGCLALPDYRDTHFTCEQSAACPDGFTCSADRICVRDPSSSSDLVTFAAGTFEMGCAPGADCPTDAQPKHQVMLSAFGIQRAEVTQAEFDACPAQTCARPVSNYDPVATPDLPVRTVTFAAATAYCTIFAKRRLPTEAEWERAARDDGGPFAWGSEAPSCDRAIYTGCTGPVAADASPSGTTSRGVVQLTGNVREWVGDIYDPSYYSSTTTWIDPHGPPSTGGQYHSVRGGSIRTPATSLSVWVRDNEDQAHSSDSEIGDIGFRCADDVR